MKERGPSSSLSVFWFRRDLRLTDNHGLYEALKAGRPVLPIFIYDRDILKDLPRRDRRVEFIHQRVAELDRELKTCGSFLKVYEGKPAKVVEQVVAEHSVHEVFFNEDYEPYARERDSNIVRMLAKKGISAHAFKDHVLFAPPEVIKDNGEPYRVYTPYSRRWLAHLTKSKIPSYPAQEHTAGFFRGRGVLLPSLSSLGFQSTGTVFPEPSLARAQLKGYGERRERMDWAGTSRVGLHLRFGTLSVREVARLAARISPVFLKELIWREFFIQMLYHWPELVSEPFDKRFLKVPWRTSESDFEAWCEGRTGYPVVDAGMRELNQTGFMHNRARMVTASFLTKHLLIDWRRGERFFAQHLLDFELASNVGNWQWAASCGADAVPYFRIFNPALQQKKFDPENAYVRRWVPEYGTDAYPPPVVEHEFARRRAIITFENALKGGSHARAHDRSHRADW